jgi:hypothetical protein
MLPWSFSEEAGRRIKSTWRWAVLSVGREVLEITTMLIPFISI